MHQNSPKIIRRVAPLRVADFDDQLWPVNCAILILAGFAAGLAMATGDFHAARWIENAWFRLGLVGLGVAALFAAIVFLRRKMVRRVQLCVVISLLVHLWLGMVLHEQYLAAVATQREAAATERLAKPERLLSVPDYHWEDFQRPPSRHAFEQPVETAAPKPTDPEPVEPRRTDHEMPPEKRPDIEPKPPRQEQPKPAKLRRAEPSAPRRAQLAAGAQISRQQWEQILHADEPIPLPKIPPREQAKSVERLETNVSAPGRRPSKVDIHQRRVFDETPSATRARPVANLARRAAMQKSPAPTPTTPIPMTKLTRPTEVAEAPISLPKPSPQREPQPSRLNPAETSRTRRTAALLPASADQPALPTPHRAADVVEVRIRPTRLDASPRLAATPQPVARQARDVSADELPSGTMLVPPVPIERKLAVGGPPSRLEATGQVAVARAASRAPSGNRIAAAGTVEPAIGTGPVPARVGQPRAVGNDRPSLAATDSAPKLARSDAVGISPRAAPIPALVSAPQAPAAAQRATAPKPTDAARATSLARGGSATPASARPNTGSGPVAVVPGAFDPIGLARSARVTRHESVSAGLSGGGIPSPARSPGRVEAPEDTFDAPQVLAGGAVEGRPGGTPLESAAGGEPRRPVGLPGDRPRAPSSGAIASLGHIGPPRPTAAAQRAAASQRDDAGVDMAPHAAATIARTDRGSQLPSLSAAPLPLSQPSGGNSTEAAVAGSGEPRRLEPGAVRDAGHIASAATLVGRKGNTTAGPTADAKRLGQWSSTLGLRTGPRRLPDGDESAQALAADVGGAPLSKRDAAGLPRGLAGPIDVVPAEPVQVASVNQRGTSKPAVAAAIGLEPAEPRARAGGLPVRIPARQGPGGLSHEPSPEVGIPSRRARPEGELVHGTTRRFLIDRSGGMVPIDGDLVELPAEAFRQRDRGERRRRVEIYGGTEETERAVEMGLAFLVQCQFDDGHWSLDQRPEHAPVADDTAPGQMTSDTAATGLSLLSFLGAGYTHQSDKHRAVVRRGLDWLVDHQKPNGDLFTGGTGYAWFYSHGIATIALCEAYGMTRDPELREPAQRAIGFIVASQNRQRGGWRYRPQIESDTSVAGWQLMALKSAQMAELDVPETTLQGVSRWLDRAQSHAGARYAYNPYGGNTPEQRAGRLPNLAMTAEGSLMRMYLGWRRDRPALRDAADFLKANLPSLGTPDRPARDVYYWYYATQVMFQMQGEYWQAWNARLQPLLQNSQQPSGPLAGSWHPTSPYRDRWGHAGGRLYVTTMNLLMLEVYYRHLPLFQTLE